MLYVTIRHKSFECMGVFDNYEDAVEVINDHMQERGAVLEHTHGSDFEGWQQIEATNGETYTIQLCELNKPA